MIGVDITNVMNYFEEKQIKIKLHHPSSMVPLNVGLEIDVPFYKISLIIYK